MAKFNCDKCGLCCMLAGKAVEFARSIDESDRNEKEELAASFPYEFDEKGRCENLNDDLTCKIYEKRPLICRVNEVWEKFHASEMTLSEHQEKVEKSCNILKKHYEH